MPFVILFLFPSTVGSSGDACNKGLCSAGTTDSGLKYCCDARCKRCGGTGCGAKDNGASAELCCPRARDNPRPPSWQVSDGENQYVRRHKSDLLQKGVTNVPEQKMPYVHMMLLAPFLLLFFTGSVSMLDAYLHATASTDLAPQK